TSLFCRWSQGLLFHQGAVDCARAALLLPLGVSILHCQPVHRCSLVETAFLLLVTVATVNMLTTVLNDSPVFPDDEEEGENVATAEQAPLLMDSPQCVLFGTFMIWFASITINLGPTFLSGALAAPGDAVHRAPSCPLIYGPLRHYILNALWISVNLVCVFLTLFHLRKLHRDLTKANVEAVRVAGLVTTLVNVTGAGGGCNQMDGGLVNGDRVRNITLHISYVHAIVNPMLFLVLHRGLRRATLDLCCGWVPIWLTAAPAPPAPPPPPPPNIALIKTTTPVRQMMPPPPPAALLLPVPPHPDSSMYEIHKIINRIEKHLLVFEKIEKYS
ncbi:unnamed protein product, partial [Acanthoscelides obtectus]